MCLINTRRAILWWVFDQHVTKLTQKLTDHPQEIKIFEENQIELSRLRCKKYLNYIVTNETLLIEQKSRLNSI